MAFRLTVIGVLSALVAAVFGLLDWFTIPRGTRAWRIGLVHGAGNVVVVGVFALSGFLRFGVAETPPARATVLALIGVGLMRVTGWLGGDLADRLGVGIDVGANLNVPNSLTDAYPRKSGRGESLPTLRPIG